MGMKVTEAGVEWGRFLPGDFETVAEEVVEAAVTSCGDDTPDLIHRASGTYFEAPEDGRHYVDQAGRVVCTAAAMSALERFARTYGESPFSRAAKSPKVGFAV